MANPRSRFQKTKTPDNKIVFGCGLEKGVEFHPIQGASAVITVGNGFQQVPVYRRGGGIYVKRGSTFLQLSAHGTSSPKIGLDALYIEGVEVELGPTGRLTAMGELKTLRVEAA